MAHNVLFKFGPKDIVFFMESNIVSSGEVIHIQTNQTKLGINIVYSVRFFKNKIPTIHKIKQDSLFSSKQDLIESL